jgi:nucleotide-binding universal stress UspA family protein
MSTKLLVPTDFSEVSHTAIQHAVKFASIINAELVILHIVASREDVSKAHEKLEQETSIGKAVDSSCSINTVVRIGNIFDDIGDVASEIGVSLIFMGTHGASRWQKITGSNALKVITNSPVPFIIVQEKLMQDSGYDHIVVPLDLNIETKQKLELVSKIAQYFDSQVHLITLDEEDEFAKNKLKANQLWAGKYLSDKNVSHSSHLVEKGQTLSEGILKLSVKVDADLIAIMNLQEDSILGILENSFQEKLVANNLMIPVLCVNPNDVIKSSFSSFI